MHTEYGPGMGASQLPLCWPGGPSLGPGTQISLPPAIGLFSAHAGAFSAVLPVKTAAARRYYFNRVDASAGTVDVLRTLDQYSGSLTQHTNPGWDNVTALGTPMNACLSTFGH